MQFLLARLELIFCLDMQIRMVLGAARAAVPRRARQVSASAVGSESNIGVSETAMIVRVALGKTLLSAR